MINLIIKNGNPFPEFNGKALSWSIGLYDTINEQNAGHPRLRCVVRAMAEHRPEQLKKERYGLLKASFDRMFGRVAARQLKVVDEEIKVARQAENSDSTK